MRGIVVDICALVFPAEIAQFCARQTLISCGGIQLSALLGCDVRVAWIPAFHCCCSQSRAQGLEAAAVNTMCEFRECRWTPVSKQLTAVGGPGGETRCRSETRTDCAELRTGEEDQVLVVLSF